MPWWAWVWPLLAWIVLAAAFAAGADGAVMVAPMVTAQAVLLIATVFAAVYHAEVVAHRVGEPFGTLVLAARRHGDRGGADRLGHARRRGGQRGAGARHGVRGRHDHAATAWSASACCWAACATTSRGSSSRARARRSPCWPRWPRSRSCCPTSRPAAPGPVFSTSQLVFAGHRVAGAVRRHSCSCRPCGTATISCRPERAARTRRRTRRRPPARRAGQPRAAAGLAGGAWWAWPRR